ncbi:hypothetical protein DFW84_10070 [Campylobacter coli]|nr:hypothetical protein [Campylobacter coli]EAJ2917453.1 hypothetical protein [Campylobacter coli]EAJ3762761.1 hypothetical protein [Campylobacter coli]EAJ3789415.1 hypothetical protein [Campylobacter coli]EAL4082706.1 hypothetical protein [Campylobacter coli]
MEQVLEAEIVEFDSEKAKINKTQLNPDEIIQLDLVVDDYNKLRQIILANVAQLKVMSDNLVQEMEIEGYNPDLVTAYSKLIETSNKSLKILTDSYKGISDILININKINVLHPSAEVKEDFEVISTADVIKRIRDSKQD